MRAQRIERKYTRGDKEDFLEEVAKPVIKNHKS